MHVILWKDQNETIVCSTLSNEYCDYKMAEWAEVFFGTKKECLEFLETIESVNNN